MNIGIDIVDIERRKNVISESPEFIYTLLSPEEWHIESFCGKIAAKEAIMKTEFIAPGKWKNTKALTLESGGPYVTDSSGKPISNISISISHTTHTAVAVAIYI